MYVRRAYSRAMRQYSSTCFTSTSQNWHERSSPPKQKNRVVHGRNSSTTQCTLVTVQRAFFTQRNVRNYADEGDMSSKRSIARRGAKEMISTLAGLEPTPPKGIDF
jgi:hypothetical protein